MRYLLHGQIIIFTEQVDCLYRALAPSLDMLTISLPVAILSLSLVRGDTKALLTLGGMIENRFFCVCEECAPEAEILEHLHSGLGLSAIFTGAELLVEGPFEDGVEDDIAVDVQQKAIA